MGSALVGARPVIEFQFSDFVTIAMDQIVNHAAKLRYMTNGMASVPMGIRAPVCSGINLGAQHSQSLEEMKAIVKTRVGEGQLELKDWPEPFPAADEVKLRIAYAGICGTDIHIIKDEWPCKPPVVLGHEFCGTIGYRICPDWQRP